MGGFIERDGTVAELMGLFRAVASVCRCIRGLEGLGRSLEAEIHRLEPAPAAPAASDQRFKAGDWVRSVNGSGLGTQGEEVPGVIQVVFARTNSANVLWGNGQSTQVFFSDLARIPPRPTLELMARHGHVLLTGRVEDCRFNTPAGCAHMFIGLVGDLWTAGSAPAEDKFGGYRWTVRLKKVLDSKATGGDEPPADEKMEYYRALLRLRQKSVECLEHQKRYADVIAALQAEGGAIVDGKIVWIPRPGGVQQGNTR